jgi:hypothetical protein
MTAKCRARRLAALFVTLASLIAPAHAADAPGAAWKFDNPFCNVIAQIQPLAGAPGYALQLGAASGTELDVHVTLVSDSDAYDAHLSHVHLSGAPNDLESDTKIVTLPNAQTINYFFVDSFAVDSGATVLCPSYVFPIGNDPTPFRIDSGATVARHLQSLGKLACGQIYRSPDLHGDLTLPIGGYGGRPVSTTLRVYIDSNGHAISEKMMQSSGVAGVDDYALGSIQLHQFLPARFLCTPVVGELLVQINYIP